MPAEKNPYAILNLQKGASDQEIKKAYFEMVKRYDPEKHTEQFMVIQNAYKRLKDNVGRAREDIYIYNHVKGEFVLTTEEREGLPIEELKNEINKLEESLKKSPENIDVRSKLILRLMQRSSHSVKKRLWAEAIEDWQKVMDSDPTHIRAKHNLIFAYITLGYSYAQHGLLAEAVDLWEKSLRMNPDNLPVIHNLAIAAERLPNPAMAQKYWSETLKRWNAILDQEPSNEYIRNCIIEVRRHLGEKVLQQKEGKEEKKASAIDEYREILKIKPNDFNAQFKIAETLMEEQKWEDAVQELHKLHQGHNQNVEIMNMLGWALLNSGQVDNAFNIWKRSLAVDPSNTATKDNLVRAHLSLGKRLRESGLYTPALVHFKALLKYLPNSAEVHFEIGSTYSMKGDIASAYREFSLTLSIDPKNQLAKKAISALKMRR